MWSILAWWRSSGRVTGGTALHEDVGTNRSNVKRLPTDLSHMLSHGTPKAQQDRLFAKCKCAQRQKVAYEARATPVDVDINYYT